MALDAGQVYVRLGGKFAPAAFNEFGRAVRKAAADMEAGEARITASHHRIAKAGDIAAAGIAGAVVGATAIFVKQTADAVKVAASFDQELRNLASRTSITGRQLTQVRKAALDLGTSFGVGAREAAKAATELVKGGVSVQKLLSGGLKGALALAVAGQMDVAQAAETVANALNQFGLSGGQAVHVADALSTAANATTADVKDMAIALSQGGAAAKAAGLSFDESVTFLEALANAGVKGSDAGTSMKTALVQLASPTKQSADLMDKLGIKIFDANGKIKSLTSLAGMFRDKLGGLTKEQRLQAASTLAGTDGMRALLALYEAGPKKIASFEDGLKKQGTAAKVAADQNKGLEGAGRKLSAAWQQAQITLGTELLPSIADGAEQVTRKLQQMADDGSLKKMGDDLADIVDTMATDLPGALDKLDEVFSAFDPQQAPSFLKSLTDFASPKEGLLELIGTAREAVVAFKELAKAYDWAMPGDQSGRVKKIQGALDAIDKVTSGLRHSDIQINFKVNDAARGQIYDLTDKLDKLGKKRVAVDVVAKADSAQAAIEGLKLAIKGVPAQRILNILTRSQSAAEQVAAFRALAAGVPASKVMSIQAKAKTAQAAVLAFTAIANGVPASRVTRVLADTNSARGQINGIIGLINAIPSGKTVTITTVETHLLRQVQQGSTAHNIKPRGKAAGGKTSGPQMYVVGEGSDPVEWIIPRDPKYRDRALGLLMDAAKTIMPGAKSGAKTGPAAKTAGKTKRYVPPENLVTAYSVDDFSKRADNYHDAIQKSEQLRKNLNTAQASLRDVERRNPKTAAQKRNKADDLARARKKVRDVERSLHELPDGGDLGKLRADWAKRKQELAAAKKFQQQIDRADQQANNAATAMRLADARDDQPGYDRARGDRDRALKTLEGLLQKAQAFSDQAGNTDRALELQGQLLSTQADIADNQDATQQPSDADQRLSDSGMTDAERAALAGINKDAALAALTEGLGDDTAAAQRKVSFLQSVLNDALVNPARGGDTTIADLADQLKTAKENLSSLAGGTGVNDNPDLQAQVDQANERTRVATENQRISDQALAAFQGFAAGGPGGLATTVVNINTLHPGDPAVWTALAQTTNAGNDLAPSKRASSVKVGL